MIKFLLFHSEPFLFPLCLIQQSDMLEKIKKIYFVFSKPRPVVGRNCGGGKMMGQICKESNLMLNNMSFLCFPNKMSPQF